MKSGEYSQQLISSSSVNVTDNNNSTCSNNNNNNLNIYNSLMDNNDMLISNNNKPYISSSTSMLSELLRKPIGNNTSCQETIGQAMKQTLSTPTTDGMINSANSSLGINSIEEISTSPGTIVRSPDELICSNTYHIDDFILESQSIGLVFENTAKLLPQREIDVKSFDQPYNDSSGKLVNNNEKSIKSSYMGYFDNSHRSFDGTGGMSMSTESLSTLSKDEKSCNIRKNNNIEQTLSSTSDKVCLKMAADSTDYTHLHSDPNFTNYQNQLSKELSLEPKHLELIRSNQNSTIKPLTTITNAAHHRNNQVPISPHQSPWCSIFYYELNVRIGDVFHTDSPTIIVDGFTEPCYRSDRFSLGGLSNVNRSLQILSTRPHIGKGIKLVKTENEVFIHCLSKSAVFVQSLSCNRYHNWHLATVVKVPPGCKLKIFDKKEFIKLMMQFEQENFEAVYSLTHFCLVRLSFVKGWGDDYKRQTVTSTPCWIEIHLNEPLKWLDPVLSRLGSPKKPCTSTS